jgi:dockerin type I repeat protein/polymorphic membrane protein
LLPRKMLLHLCIVLGLASLSTTNSMATNLLRVPSSRYPTIQAAIDRAETDDTIILSPQTYHENLVISNKTISLTSIDPEDPTVGLTTVIQGDSKAPVLRFKHVTGNYCRINGLTIQGGKGWGGGIHCHESNLILLNSVIHGNTSPGQGGGIAAEDSNIVIKNSTIENNIASEGGGLYGYRTRIIILNSRITNNRTNLSLPFGRGAGICLEENCNALILAAMIKANRSASCGGGIFSRDSRMEVRNSILVGNTSQSYGGAVYADRSTVSITNVTMSGNKATWCGGAIRALDHTRLSIMNSIVWNNKISQPTWSKTEIALATASHLDISYTDLQGGQGNIMREPDCNWIWVRGNIIQKPGFVKEGYWKKSKNKEDLYVEGDYHLSPNSPCVNAGHPHYKPPVYDTDWEGQSRVMWGQVDMGADEVGGTKADFNLDGIVDSQDLALLKQAWSGDQHSFPECDLTQDGKIDFADWALFAKDWLWRAPVYELQEK